MRRYPGATYIVLRPRSGSAVSTSLPDDYQFDMCQNILDQYYDVRLLYLYDLYFTTRTKIFSVYVILIE